MPTSGQNSIRVVKLGGSLLDDFDSSDTRASCLYSNEAVRADATPLRARIRRWLSLQEPMKTIWIVGGGEHVDQLRTAFQDRDHETEKAHWLAVTAMNANSILLRFWFPKWHWVDQLSSLSSERSNEVSNNLNEDSKNSNDDSKNFNDDSNNLNNDSNNSYDNSDNYIFQTKSWLQSNPELTPHSWDVTSDSIAATLAAELRADELVLLKSRQPPASTIIELSTANYVDKHFPIAISNCKPGFKCRFVNFRHLEFQESSLIVSPVSRDN